MLAVTDWGAQAAIGLTAFVSLVSTILAHRSRKAAQREAKEASASKNAVQVIEMGVSTLVDQLQERVKDLNSEVVQLREDVKRLEKELKDEHRLKHDWRSFAGSLYSERQMIRRIAQIDKCGGVEALMVQLDELRQGNPLMKDIAEMIEGDP